MKYVSAIFLLFIIVVIVLADIGSVPPLVRALYRFPNGDKAGHFVLYGLLNFFLTRAFISPPAGRPRGRVTVSISLILALIIALEEWSQQYFSTRTFDLLDLLASYLGLTVGGWMAWRWSA
jgi:polysaccharide biosynthesis protein VpsQ